MLLDLKPGIIYGPINSRRLGQSLGLNILPNEKKVCSFNCLYCQYGLKKALTFKKAGIKKFPLVDEVLKALKNELQNIKQQISYITFSGNGESTLHPKFKEIVEEVCKIRDLIAPNVKTAILSNSTTLNRKKVREALALLDVPILKLDAGSEQMFAKFNRPASDSSLKETISGLASLENITIQSLFSKGELGNFSSEHLQEWVKKVKIISPLNVQLYTLDRQSPTKSLIPLEKNELQYLQYLLEKENIPSQVF